MPFPSAFEKSQKSYDDIFDDFKRVDQEIYGGRSESTSDFYSIQNPVQGYYNQNLYGPLITVLLVAFCIILICKFLQFQTRSTFNTTSFTIRFHNLQALQGQFPIRKFGSDQRKKSRKLSDRIEKRNWNLFRTLKFY